jgi:hypothetical protein
MRERAKFAATNIRPSFCQFDAPLLTLTPLAYSSLRPPLVQRRARLSSDGAACFIPPVEDGELKLRAVFRALSRNAVLGSSAKCSSIVCSINI